MFKYIILDLVIAVIFFASFFHTYAFNPTFSTTPTQSVSSTPTQQTGKPSDKTGGKLPETFISFNSGIIIYSIILILLAYILIRLERTASYS